MSTLIRLFGALLYMTCMVPVNASTKTIAVTDNQCSRTYVIDEETLFVYSGEELSFPCEIIMDGSPDGVCVAAITYNVTCDDGHFALEYSKSRHRAGQAITCYSLYPSTRFCSPSHIWMTIHHIMYSNVETRFPYIGTNITLKVEREHASTVPDDDDDDGIAVGPVVGTIVGLLVLIGMGIVTVVVFVVCCKRKQGTAGMVYNNSQQIQTTVVSQAPMMPDDFDTSPPPYPGN